MYLTYFKGVWAEGNVPIYGAMDHSVWLASSVFDGARAFRGLAPDLDLHLERVRQSAAKLGLDCPYSVAEMTALVKEGMARFPKEAELYIRPLVFGTEGFLVPTKSGFALTLWDAPMPQFTGFTACLTALRRPTALMAPIDAKASGLYPNSTRALQEASKRGFNNAVILDAKGQVAEFATSNLFFVTPAGQVVTPAADGSFLAGITRARVISLLAQASVMVEERGVKTAELDRAQEIFNTGNFGKVQPCIRYESRALPVGPIATLARDRYMAFAAGTALK
jgi:branched-chain amino acid aminotransferase